MDNGAHVVRTVGGARRSHAYENDIEIVDPCIDGYRCLDPAFGAGLLQQVVEAGFAHRRDGRVDLRHLLRIDVEAKHAVALACDAASRCGADIAKAENADLHVSSRKLSAFF